MMRKSLRAVVTVGLPVAAALLAAACSSGSSSPGATATGSAAGASSGSKTVITVSSGSAGTYLTSGGRAVYLFDKDGKDKSNCSGACAGVWPPVTASSGVSASGGAVAADLGTITSGSTKQVTYNGHPLYFYTGDTAAGQTNGQGKNEFGAKWWLVSSSGAAMTSAVSPTPSPSSSSSSSGGYGY